MAEFDSMGDERDPRRRGTRIGLYNETVQATAREFGVPEPQRVGHMELEELREQAIAHLRLRLPGAGDPSQLVDECLASALLSFKKEFIVMLSPEAWARMALIHCKHFLDTGCDVSVGEMVAMVLRDSIHIGRMDMLTQQLATHKLAESATTPPAATPTLTLVKK